MDQDGRKALRDDEKQRLQADLGAANFLMLRNHGLLTVGRTVPDVFMSMYLFESTCRIRVDAQAGGEVVQVNPAIVQGIAEVMKTATMGMGMGMGAALAWPALLRKLERTDPGSRTGGRRPAAPPSALSAVGLGWRETLLQFEPVVDLLDALDSFGRVRGGLSAIVAVDEAAQQDVAVVDIGVDVPGLRGVQVRQP